MHKKKDNTKLLKPASAVEAYFDTLLQEQKADPLSPLSVKPEGRLLALPGIEADLAKIGARDEKAATKTSDPRDQESEAEHARETNRELEFPLQCLMFSVQGNQLALPLIELGGVLDWTENLTRLPESPDWMLGLIQYRGQNVRLADAAKVLTIPLDGIQYDSKHILVFAGENWAITCDILGDVVNVCRDDVQWTKDGTPGLSMGVIKDSLAILIDPYRVLRFFDQDDIALSRADFSASTKLPA